jgi:drug/metabolite transporter (DMT)-like permease
MIGWKAMLYGFALALFSSLAWSGLDALRKVLVQTIPPMPLVLVLTLGQVPFFLGWRALDPGGSIDWPRYGWIGITEIAVNGLSSLGFVSAVRMSPFSRTVPFLALSPGFTALSAWVLLDEALAWSQVLGVLLVAAGATALAIAPSSSSSAPASRGAPRWDRGSLLMVVVAFGWSVTTSLDKMALSASPPAAHALVQSLGLVFLLGLFLGLRGRLGELRVPSPVRPTFFLALVCASLAIGAQLMAVQLILVTMVETMKRMVGGVMAVVLGAWQFGEPMTPRKIGVIAAMSLGAVLVLA